jgi:hypothetical protein
MAGALTPEQQWALIQAHGSIENARDEAIRRSPELGELWNAWWPQTPDFWKVFWKRALPVLDMEIGPAETKPPAEARESSHVAEVELAGVEPDLSGRPLPAVAVLRALRAYASEKSIQQVAKDEDIDLSFRGARRVYSWVASGTVWWDRTQQKVRVAAGYLLLRGGTKAEPTLQLVRV